MDEPQRVAEAAKELNLRHVVITSVTRDDLPDGGAQQFARTISAIKNLLPEAAIEVLTPDFKGNIVDLHIVLAAMPDVFNHNIETIPSLYNIVRPQADYKRSLDVLREAHDYSIDKKLRVKSGLMVGFGERFDQVVSVINDLRQTGCELLTIGQYMRPSKKNLPVVEYIVPEVFEQYKKIAYDAGFSFVASGPLVRSSMNADEMLRKLGKLGADTI
jgi:lipoic acid synthetase